MRFFGIGLLCLCAVADCFSGFAGGFCMGCWLAEGEGSASMDCVAGGGCFGGYVALVGCFVFALWWYDYWFGWGIDRAAARVESTDAERYHPCFERLNAPADGCLSD